MNPELSYTQKPVDAEPQSAPQSFFSRLIGVWFSPAETFAGIGRAPQMLAPILVLMIMGGATSYLMVSRIGVSGFFRAGFEQAVAKGQMSQEQADQRLQTMTNGPAAVFIKFLFPIIGLVQSLVLALILVGIAKLITGLAGGENAFKPLFCVSLYTLLGTGVVSTVILITVLYLKPAEEIDVNNLLGSNLAALLTVMVGKDGLPKFIMALARWVDVFAIWIIALLAIGYGAVTKRVKSSTFGATLGGIYLVVALIAAAWTTLTR
ncbi:MAG: YIP1 family protein [Chloracidobacterium sp.]|nr:YIP1 family protein [Chloracidobacterium sp.]